MQFRMHAILVEFFLQTVQNYITYTKVHFYQLFSYFKNTFCYLWKFRCINESVYFISFIKKTPQDRISKIVLVQTRTEKKIHTKKNGKSFNVNLHKYRSLNAALSLKNSFLVDGQISSLLSFLLSCTLLLLLRYLCFCFLYSGKSPDTFKPHVKESCLVELFVLKKKLTSRKIVFSFVSVFLFFKKICDYSVQTVTQKIP